MMKNDVTRFEMAVHTNDSGKTKIDHTENSFLFFTFLGKVHIAYINRHKIGNIHGAQMLHESRMY